MFSNIYEYSIKFLANTKTIEYIFINEIVAQIICDKLKIRLIIFSRLKYLSYFNEIKVKSIIYIIYSKFTIQNYNKLIIFLFITKIEFYFIILDKS